MRVTWIMPDGTEITDAEQVGTNLMQAALDNDIAGIDGECGGCLSCATCHVQVDPAWIDRTGTPDDMEDAMLEAVEAPRTATSRLSCQIEASNSLDGLRLHVPSTDG